MYYRRFSNNNDKKEILKKSGCLLCIFLKNEPIVFHIYEFTTAMGRRTIQGNVYRIPEDSYIKVLTVLEKILPESGELGTWEEVYELAIRKLVKGKYYYVSL